MLVGPISGRVVVVGGCGVQCLSVGWLRGVVHHWEMLHRKCCLSVKHAYGTALETDSVIQFRQKLKAESHLKSAEEQKNLSMVYWKVAFWGAVQKQGLIGGVVMCVVFLFCWFDLVWLFFFTVR